MNTLYQLEWIATQLPSYVPLEQVLYYPGTLLFHHMDTKWYQQDEDGGYHGAPPPWNLHLLVNQPPYQQLSPVLMMKKGSQNLWL